MSDITENPKSDGNLRNKKPTYIKKDDNNIEELKDSYKQENDQHYSTDTEEE